MCVYKFFEGYLWKLSGSDNNLDYISWHKLIYPFFSSKGKMNHSFSMLTLRDAGHLPQDSSSAWILILCEWMKQLWAVVIQMREDTRIWMRVWNKTQSQTQAYSSAPHLFIHLFLFSSLHNYSSLFSQQEPRPLIHKWIPSWTAHRGKRGRGIEKVRDDKILKV